jgi:hypothetical protein
MSVAVFGDVIQECGTDIYKIGGFFESPIVASFDTVDCVLSITLDEDDYRFLLVDELVDSTVLPEEMAETRIFESSHDVSNIHPLTYKEDEVCVGDGVADVKTIGTFGLNVFVITFDVVFITICSSWTHPDAKFVEVASNC